MVVASIGITIKPGFLTKNRSKHKFLRGTIKKYGNKKGMVKKVIK